MAKLKGLIGKKAVVQDHPLVEAEKVSYDAFDAFRAAQTGLAQSNDIAAQYAEDQESFIAAAQAEIEAAQARIVENNRLAAKLAEFTG